MTGDTLKLTKAQTDKLIDHVRDREVLYNLTRITIKMILKETTG